MNRYYTCPYFAVSLWTLPLKLAAPITPLRDDQVREPLQQPIKPPRSVPGAGDRRRHREHRQHRRHEE